MKNIYGYQLPHSTLILYGNNMKTCMPYIDDAIDSVEDVCKYCSQHNLRILCQTDHSVQSLIEYLRVYRLAKRYSVRGSWRELPQYFENSK